MWKVEYRTSKNGDIKLVIVGAVSAEQATLFIASEYEQFTDLEIVDIENLAGKIWQIS